MKIEVFSSPGCSKCSHAKVLLKQLVEEMGEQRIHWREVNVLDELDYAVDLGVLTTPAIAIDGVLVFPALPSEKKLRAYLLQHLAGVA